MRDRDGEIGDVAVRIAGEEVDRRNEMQEAGAIAVDLGDERVRALQPFGEMARDVSTHAVGALVWITPRRQLERDEPRHEREDECRIRVVCGTDTDGGLRCRARW